MSDVRSPITAAPSPAGWNIESESQGRCSANTVCNSGPLQAAQYCTVCMRHITALLAYLHGEFPGGQTDPGHYFK